MTSNLANRSSTRLRILKSEAIQKQILSSSEYLQLFKEKQQKPEGLIYDSLLHYQKQISLLKGFLVISGVKANHFRKLKTFNQIYQRAKYVPLPIEPLTEQQQSSAKPNHLTKQCQELAQILEQREQNQREAQLQFLRAITQQFKDDGLKQTEAVYNIQRVLNRKVSRRLNQCLKQITKKAFPEKPSQTKIKNVLTSSLMMLSIKMKETNNYVFRTLLKQFGLESIVDQIDASLRLKGKALMGLKQYPRLNLKRAFWRWHLSSTDQGERLFQTAADKLVLYTNINKTTVFYRLFNTIKVREIKVDPKVKRMALMFHLYTKIYFERPMRQFYEKVKIRGSNQKQQSQVQQKLIKSAQMRQKDVMKRWVQKLTVYRQEEKQKKEVLAKFAKKLIQVSEEKKKFIIQDWKQFAQRSEKINKIKQQYLSRLLTTKAVRLVDAIKTWRHIPFKINKSDFKKATRFEKGLAVFAQRTMKRAIDAFRNEYEQGQAQKKRAVIQLIDCTQGRQKRLYNRWKQQIFSNNLYLRTSALQQMFQSTKSALDRNYNGFFIQRQYNLFSISRLHKYFTSLSYNTRQSLVFAMNTLRSNSKATRFNKWFQKAADTLALRSKINIQKSIWRLQVNADKNCALSDTAIFAKLKKMYNNICKRYELTLFRAFLTIDKYGRAVQNTDLGLSRNKSDFVLVQGSYRQQSVISEPSMTELQSTREDTLYSVNRKAAVCLIQYVFNQNLSNQMNRWKYNVLPYKQLIQTNALLENQHPDVYAFLNQSKGIQKIVGVVKLTRVTRISWCFRSIWQYCMKSTDQNSHDRNVQQRIQLINQQNSLLEEVRQYKGENQSLAQQLQEKQFHLEEANKAVTLLSLKINFMITQKFISTIEKVIQNSNWTNINDGFDGIIQTANMNFQSQQSKHLPQQ